MNLVFQADGLSVGEGAFLMACCNHTDDRGYVIASMQQLADESHMTERNARNNKQRLIKRGLLAAADRYHPKTGARIADLYRVNLDLLGRMRRKRTDYGPTVVEELTFATSEETAGQTPRKILPPPPEDLAAPPEESSAPPENPSGTPPAESAPLLLPSSFPSSLPLGAADVGAESGTTDEGEREAAAPGGKNPSDAEVPQQRERSQQGAAAEGRVVAAYAAALGRTVLNSTRVRLERQAVELLAQGLPEAWLCDRARELAARGWSDLVRHAERSTVPVEGQRDESRPGLPQWCGECGEGTPAARLNPRFRTLGEAGTGEKCPRCHPHRVPVGA